jgi:hypothetical protein
MAGIPRSCSWLLKEVGLEKSVCGNFLRWTGARDVSTSSGLLLQEQISHQYHPWSIDGAKHVIQTCPNSCRLDLNAAKML